MTELESPPQKRLKFSRKELEELSKEDLVERWLEQDKYVDILETRNNEGQKDSRELLSLRESEDKLRQQQLEATRRENLLVVRLAAKEQEMQEYASQIQELKQSQTPGSSQLRSTLLDPAVNLMFENMKKELIATKAKLEETQNELSAWKFTPDRWRHLLNFAHSLCFPVERVSQASEAGDIVHVPARHYTAALKILNTGKRLMAKCRLLYQENEELGKMISSGRMAKLEGDLALQKNFSEEMKKSQTELDDFLLELDEDVEGMQSTILYLQQQLKESKEQIGRLQCEIRRVQIEQTRPTSFDTHSPKNSTSTSSSDARDVVDHSVVLNYVKRNGNINGSIVSDRQETELVVNGGNCVSDKSKCDKTKMRTHSPSRPQLDERMDVDGEWSQADVVSRGKMAACSSDDEKLMITESRDDCDSVGSSYTPPRVTAGGKDEKLCMSPLSEKRDSSETGDEKMVNGSGSLSDDDV
uniref:Pre-mRNA-splicing regulator WTAP n=1 Tax=Strigamia maritima TaxID=126957 RepID=T1JJM3_STRMM